MASLRKRGKNWYIRLRDETGKLREVKGCTDKGETKRIASELEARVARVKAGLDDPIVEERKRESRSKELKDHLADWIGVLEARGSNATYVLTAKQRVLLLLELSGCRHISDLTTDRVEVALGKLRDRKGIHGQKLSDLSIKHYARVLGTFTAWLEEVDRVERDPLAKLRMPHATGKKRWPLTADQARLLIAETPKHKVSWKLTGQDRAMAYAIAIGTGFRLNELTSLTKQSFQLDGDRPTITVEAKHTKNKKRAIQPIQIELAEFIRPWLASKSDGVLFRLGTNDAAILVREDLEACGIDTSPPTPEHCQFNFHCLRHTYTSLLVSAGVDPKVFQVLVRHSTPALTLSIYAHDNSKDREEGIKRMKKIV